MANRTPRRRVYGRPLVERMLYHTNRTAGGCWEWTAARQAPTRTGSGGYGFVRIDKTNRMAHRVMYELLVEPIPDGLQLDHLCRNRLCVNPAHLEPVTPLENTQRGMRSRGTPHKTHCPQGHPYAGDNLYVYQGRRHCVACRREAVRRFWQRQKAS